MSHPADDLFAQFRDPAQGREIAEADRQTAYEERCVKLLLRHAGVTLDVAGAKRQQLIDGLPTHLDFDWFHRQYPKFPVNMGSSKMRGTAGSKIGWSQLFDPPSFRNLPWVREYMDQAARFNWNVQSNRCAMIFNAPHAGQATTMVVHNQPVQNTVVTEAEYRKEYFPRLIFPMGRPAITLVLESFQSFMETVGTNWTE